MSNTPKDEYFCTNVEEKEHLQSKGFRYTFAKTIMDTKVTTCWKYTKSIELFETLIKYYS